MLKTLQNPYFIAFLGGLFCALGIPTKPGFYFFLFPVLGYFLLFTTLKWNESQNTSLLKRLGLVLVFCVGATILGYYWIPYTISEFGGIYFPWNYLLGLIFSLIVLPHLFIVTVIFHYLEKKGQFSFFTLPNIFLLSFIYVTVERWTPQQFPAHLGHFWGQLAPYLGLAPHFGAPLFSFMSMLLVFGLLGIFKKKVVLLPLFLLPIIFLGLNFSFPLKKYPDYPTEGHNIRLVQANIGNLLKLSSAQGQVESVSEVYDRFFRLSTKESLSPIDLLIWPETAFPNTLNSIDIKAGKRSIPPYLSRIISETGAEFITGGYDNNPRAIGDFEREYNAAFHFDRHGQLKNVYHKKVLIPFGEGLPFGPFNSYISPYIQNISYFAKGENFVTFKTEKGTPFITAICYEILFSRFIRKYLNSLETRPHFLINFTNDSWYGDSSEPFQHLFLAKWRALEFSIPIIRITNTGISSIIYPNGEESERLGVFTKGVLDHYLQTAPHKIGLYQRIGFLGTFIVFLFLYGLSLIAQRVSLTKSPL